MESNFTKEHSMLKILITAALVFVGTQVFAHEGHEHEHGDGPCKSLRDACKSAGFEMGKHKEGKGMMMDCMGKIAKGEKVEGVTFDTAAPENKACMDHLAMKKEHMEEKMAERKEERKAARKAAKDAKKTETH
jgi:hypothetical protein